MTWDEWAETVRTAAADARLADLLDHDPAFLALLRQDPERALRRFELFAGAPRAAALPTRSLPAAWRFRMRQRVV